jgi:hypothetical protein
MIGTEIEDQALSSLPCHISNNCVIYHITKLYASNLMKLAQRLFAGLLSTADDREEPIVFVQKRKPEFKDS